MCLDRMKLLLTNPGAAIAKGKNPKEMQTTLIILVVTWALIGLSFAVVTRSGLLFLSLSTALLVFLLGLVCSLVFGFLVQIVLTILGGKGQYYHGLTALAYAKFPIALGLLVGSVLTLAPAGFPLAILTVLVFTLIGLATLYRAVKEFFGVDIITAWIGISVLVLGTMLSLYAILFFLVAGNTSLGMGMMSSRMFGY